MMTRTFVGSLSMLMLAICTNPLRGDENPPLVVVQLSEATLNRLIQETIERESEVNEEILATHVVGTAKTTGTPRVCLVECDAGPTVKAVFSGSTVSRTVGYHFPVVIYSRARTDFTVEKLIAIEQLGDVVPHSTKFRASTETVTENITTSRRGLLGRLVLRRAWRAVEASRPEANALAQRDAEKEILAAFDDALASRIEKVKKQMSLRNLVSAVLPADAVPATRSTTKDGYLTVAVFARAPDEKVVTVPLPKLPCKPQPVQIWLHKSVVGSNGSTTGIAFDAAQRWLAIPALLASAANTVNSEPNGLPRWITVDDWFVVQVNRLDK